MQGTNGVRFAELMAALSVATDFAMEQPVEHALASCVLAMRFGESAGHPEVSGLELLRTVVQGLSTLGDLDAEVFPGHCEAAQRLGTRLGFAGEFVRGLGELYARWDGSGFPPVRGCDHARRALCRARAGHDG